MPHRVPPATETAEALQGHAQRVAELRRAGACLGYPGTADLVETHISSLLFAGPWVFKLKKPVVMPFVDFSSLELRHDACQQELRLNRRTAPRWYIGVVPVRQTPAGPVIVPVGVPEPPALGEVVDWAVQMRHFDDRQLFSRLAQRGQLGPEQVSALAEVVARFHAQQAPAPPGFGRAEATRHLARQNLVELAELADRVGAARPADDAERAALRSRVAALQQWTEQRGAALAPLMELRCRTGHVREVHGDLHLGNVVWADDAPVLFDALEFDDTMRHTDTIGDLAFTFMDLLAHGLPRLAWRFVSEALEASGDHAALPLLRWWAVHRATVRAKVAMLTPADGSDRTARARHYLDVAATLAGLSGQPLTPRLVLTCGLSGSGKTRVAGQMAERLGGVRVRSDVERKRLFALPPTARGAPDLYTPDATRRTYERLQEVADEALAGQVSIVVDAASLLRRERDAMRALAARHGAAFTLLVCRAPMAALQSRLQARQAEGHDASDATVEVLARQQQWAERPGADETGDTLVLDTDGSLDELAQRIEALPL
jgi:hypothetical protein